MIVEIPMNWARPQIGAASARDCETPTSRDRTGLMALEQACHENGPNFKPAGIAVVGTFQTSRDVRFSNRPVGVKHFQTIHRCCVDVSRGLVLLFGIGTGALPSWDSKTRRNNLWGGLAVRLTAGPSGHTNSPHPSSREGHHSTAQWSSVFSLLDLIL